MHYRAYFLDADNHIRHAHDLECASDAEARERLNAMDRNGFAAELWRGERRILHLSPPQMADAGADAGQCPPEPS